MFRPIFAFFIVKHESREVVHFNVTRSPSDEWVAQQLREATPYGEGRSRFHRIGRPEAGSIPNAVSL